MGSSRLAFVAVAVAAVAAAGGGSYLATRHNAQEFAVVPAAAAPPGPAVATLAPVEAQAPLIVATAPTAPTPATTTPAPTPQRRPDPRPSVRPDIASASASTTTRREEPSPTEAPAATPAPVAAVTPVVEESPAPPIDARAIEAPRPAEPPARTFEELVVSSDAVIGLQTEGLLSSDRARVEDRVEARVSRDVRVGSTVAIPAGSRAFGTVVVVERGGRLRDRARLGIRFHTLQLVDGTSLPISTETIYRYGDAPGNGSAAKIGGGAVAGAILGAIIGGGKGAAIGAATGAGAGTATVMAGDRSAAVFPPGSDVTARILSPLTISVERE